METLNSTSQYLTLHNGDTVVLSRIPVSPYDDFYKIVLALLKSNENHCVNYYAYPTPEGLSFICCIANDTDSTIYVLSHVLPKDSSKELLSLTRDSFPMHIYEREIAENFGIDFIYHPWKKPLRYAFDRADRNQCIENYPFFQIDGNEIHQIGVGPIHAGVIEPGHFRFLCNGETVLHLEIQLGWQHRGVESLFLKKPALLQRTILAESIAGDTSVGHSTAFVNMMESMGSLKITKRLEIERAIALELERIAIHVGDLSGICVDVAYQLGASVFGALRTPAINFFQTWCGNRFGKGLNRVGGSHYPLTEELILKLIGFLDLFEKSFNPMASHVFDLASFLMRAENIGKVSVTQMEHIGAVGMVARMAGVDRDIRKSHPFSGYKYFSIPSEQPGTGDVWARAKLRALEISDSIAFIRKLTDELLSLNEENVKPISEKYFKLAPNSFSISLVEGWRGEICHCAITNSDGSVEHYKVKDPSLHNWFALALSLRDLEISDFPVNNKSYNLSYCGHDL